MTCYIDPSSEQFLAFKNLPIDTPIMMLNLLQFKAYASYADESSVTGIEAYRRYGDATALIFSRVGGSIMWRGRPDSILIGPHEEQWDTSFIAHYPTAAAFLAMVTDPEYQASVYHRQAAVENSRLIRFGVMDGNATFA
ncbi:MAG: hypothetical protein ACI9T7_001447 [Oleiphilaceae bacterium]|jgi:uncharacterized protein (DUF1330 family)